MHQINPAIKLEILPYEQIEQIYEYLQNTLLTVQHPEEALNKYVNVQCIVCLTNIPIFFQNDGHKK